MKYKTIDKYGEAYSKLQAIEKEHFLLENYIAVMKIRDADDMDRLRSMNDRLKNLELQIVFYQTLVDNLKEETTKKAKKLYNDVHATIP